MQSGAYRLHVRYIFLTRSGVVSDEWGRGGVNGRQTLRLIRSRIAAFTFGPAEYAVIPGDTVVGIRISVASAYGLVNLDADRIRIDFGFINAVVRRARRLTGRQNQQKQERWSLKLPDWKRMHTVVFIEVFPGNEE
jgi:hypothetical protein